MSVGSTLRLRNGRSKIVSERVSMRESSLGERIVPAEVKAHRFVELDSLRGIAASAVVFGYFYLLWSSTRCYVWIQRAPS